MNFDPKSFGMDFRPPMEGAPAILLSVIAEETIVQAITEKSDSGLRIIRHLMSNMSSHSLPDFNNPETIRLLARKFVQEKGYMAMML